MKNIHVLKTDKPSRLYSYKNNLFLTTESHLHSPSMEYQNIYITSDEEIKEGDYYLPFSKSIIKNTTKYGEIGKSKTNMDFSLDYVKKIILTTDQDLIKDGVQNIDNEFLEWFVKNTSCEEVEVSHLLKSIFDPKTNEKYPVVQHRHFDLDKMICEYKYEIIIPKEEYKQETLEEVAERLYSDKEYPMYGEIRRDGFIKGARWQQEQYTVEEQHVGHTIDELDKEYIKGFNEGSAYQQERMYSEKDMKQFGDWCRNGLLNTEYGFEKLDEHLEQWKQFKKK